MQAAGHDDDDDSFFGRSWHGVVAIVQDCDIEAIEFEFQSYYNVYFRIYIHRFKSTITVLL